MILMIRKKVFLERLEVIKNDLNKYHFENIIFDNMHEEDKESMIFQTYGFINKEDFYASISKVIKSDKRLLPLSNKNFINLAGLNHRLEKYLTNNYRKLLTKQLNKNEKIKTQLNLDEDLDIESIETLLELNIENCFEINPIIFQYNLSAPFIYNFTKKFNKLSSALYKKIKNIYVTHTSLEYYSAKLKKNKVINKKEKNTISFLRQGASIKLVENIDLLAFEKEFSSLGIKTVFINSLAQFNETRESISSNMSFNSSDLKTIGTPDSIIFNQTKPLKFNGGLPAKIIFFGDFFWHEIICNSEFSQVPVMLSQLRSLGYLCIINYDKPTILEISNHENAAFSSLLANSNYSNKLLEYANMNT